MRDWPEASMAGQCSDEHFLAIALETGLREARMALIRALQEVDLTWQVIG